ncbi:hypothetical protein NE237_024024 [Protea cynaroides]|uniref:Disease resistance N-terminal domain-containing protein n=1 Tax=Protea cynaroides TaxID=273540 RepID=A0A9Q0K6K7_9MAGN|nr:hypothetical protein NE237_024024 [Protea cynaroides]
MQLFFELYFRISTPYFKLGEFGLIWGVNGEMKRLSSALLSIRDVVEDAEVKQFKDKAIRGWLKKLKDVAYDADDILDERTAKALQLEARMRNCSNQLMMFGMKIKTSGIS